MSKSDTLDFNVAKRFSPEEVAVVTEGDAFKSLKKLPDNFAKLIVSSPPYNIGKEYETKVELEQHLESMQAVCRELWRILDKEGSLCWQVGNFVNKGELFPLDIYYYPIFKNLGFHLRNRIIWHFDHGLHTSKRFSGRYETLLWFSKDEKYTFNLDSVRVPSKYPGKRHYKPGPKYGKLSGNPLGKNPTDIWKIIEHDWDTCLWEIPNVKANHPEKTTHVCQFPIELAERCILALSNEKDWVVDPFSGAGSALIAALKNGRRALGIDREKNYIRETKKRIKLLKAGKLPYRQIGKPVHSPNAREKVAQWPSEWDKK